MTSLVREGRPVELGERGILQPGRWLWLRSLAWLVGFIFLIVLSFGPVGQALKNALPKDDPALQFAAQCVGAAIALGVYVLLVRLAERRRPSELAWRPAIGELGLGLVVGLIMFAVVMAILAGSGLYAIAFHGPNPAWRAAGLAINAGVVEELLVRGIILRLLWRGFGPAVAFIGSAALFGAGHLPNPESSLFAALCIALEAGVMLGAFYALTGRLWMSIGVHIGWNFTQGYLFGTAVSGSDFGPALATSTATAGQATWLTGGAFGPEASLPALLVCSSVGFATMWMAWKGGRFERNDAPAGTVAAAEA